MTPFEITLSKFEISLNNLLNSNFKKINVQGCHKPNCTQLLFTIFDEYNYTMEFLTIKNLRMYRIDGDPSIEEENINKYIETFKKPLEKYL